MDLSGLNLPQSVVDRVMFTPFDDLLLAIFKRGLPDLDFRLTLPEKLPLPIVTANRFARGSAGWSGDPRFIDNGAFRVNVFTDGLNAEIEGQFIAEAIRVMLYQAHTERWHFPGLGSILKIELMVEPNNQSDWATSTGIVQYADLPKGVARTEAIYDMTIRRPN